MRVLIIGSLAAELGVAARIAIAQGAAIDQANTIETALRTIRQTAVTNLIICDLSHNIPTLISCLTAERFFIPVVAAGIGDNEEAALAAISAGAREFLPLPPDVALIAAILAAVAVDTSSRFIAHDPIMLALRAQAEQIAKSNASILITGESGTGKEVLARLIHDRSKRSSARFIAVNCAAIPHTLLEAELFGHEKGAFSGAVARRAGKFEAAHGGTLLLDEIAELDIRIQAKLLRALQERVVDRLGGDQPVPVDVRILAATNSDLRAAIEAGRFREDLFFRLNVICLHIPPLRERIDDIPALASYFVDHYVALNNTTSKFLSKAALDRLKSHVWRGNVRELDNIMHRAVLLTGGSVIDADDIDLPSNPSIGLKRANFVVSKFVGQRVETVEQALILETLDHCLGNRTHAATILGISIRALRNKLRDYAAQGVIVPAPHTGVAA